MTIPWKRGTDLDNAGGDSELNLIPRWSIFLSVIVFVATQYLFHGYLPHSKPGMLPMRMMMSYSSGTAFASYVLLIGYVSRDVKRRKMSASLWVLLVILMPGGIGAVVYFLLRQPILSRCPNCTTELASDFHFCPQCQFQMAPACGKCFRSVQITDVYCVQCGHDLAEDHSPARLQAYRD
ncbi:Phospholipase_D-nuclease N-terminal [Granulicella pectinivorans]|jgi:hypothetical protein|uniref:Phospholipase_D-nuclease N-terminal n=1 Tax=Granulicella pectinivorans TaxID=474950 RepID=A0A1I6LWV3_9BACT|nr:zinc ribbon domain-containing protein [Granulicella pectinivorans]SFS07959.1 Phospholipase_D-nuclease N-terminal [Granulicella pectinivorans]